MVKLWLCNEKPEILPLLYDYTDTFKGRTKREKISERNLKAETFKLSDSLYLSYRLLKLHEFDLERSQTIGNFSKS